MKTVAPAKINWTLEVLGRREDGYHEIRSVMQTIDLCDEVVVNRAPDLQEKRDNELRRLAHARRRRPKGLFVTMKGMPVRFQWVGDMDIWGPDDGPNPWAQIASRVVEGLDPAWERDASVELRKRIPLAAGLGGGSSDAGALLRVLNLLWKLGLERDRLVEAAASIGSDATFFLYGGTALAEGRGERVTQLPDAPAAWPVLLAPPIKMPDKTKRIYGALKAEDLTDGSRGGALVRRIKTGEAVREADLYNVFEKRAYQMFEGLETYRDALLAAGAATVHLAGAGPALFALAESEAEARELADRVQSPGARVFVARTLTAEEATAVTD